MASTTRAANVSLRPATMEDAPDMQQYMSDREVAERIGAPHPYGDGRAEWFLRESLAQRESARMELFAVIAEDRFVGLCGVSRDEEDDKKGEVAYWIGRPFWGNGYATEALRLVTRFGFGEFGCDRMLVGCAADNIASRRVIEKNRYRFVRADQNDGEEACHFEMTRDEYESVARDE